VSAETQPLPTEFSHEKNVRWSVSLGYGVASPVVVGGRVFVTAMSAPEEFSVSAYDAKTGKPLWSRALPTGKLPDITQPNGHASSTPVTDGERLYVYFSTLGLVAFDVDGNQLWRRPLPEPHYLLEWGAAASPILYKDLVIYNSDDDLDAYLIAVDKKTGDVRWRVPRPEMLGGYAVPVVCTVGGRDELIVAGSGKLKGYDPSNGNEFWTCNTLLRTVMTTPVVHGDTVYISIQSYGDTDRVLKYALLQWKDTNQDGKLTLGEVPLAFEKKFRRGDTNQDGVLEDNEIDEAFQAATNRVGGGNTIQAVRAGGKGDVTKTHVRWNVDNRAPSNIASPLVWDDRLLVVKKGGISSCFDANSGEPQWYLKRVKNRGNYYASPVAGDGKIYIAGENGTIVVLAADSPELKVLARNDMGDSCIATPAISGGSLYVRTAEKLFCVAQPN
jgi:outer membrane protein assembly factor BamB